MAEPPAPSSRPNWLWIILIALLAVLLLAWLFSPSGDRDGAVEDPIVTGDVTEPGAAEGAGTVGTGLPQPGDGTGLAEPVDDSAPGAGVAVDPLPE
jgi:hypothetical protein